MGIEVRDFANTRIGVVVNNQILVSFIVGVVDIFSDFPQDEKNNITNSRNRGRLINIFPPSGKFDLYNILFIIY